MLFIGVARFKPGVQDKQTAVTAAFTDHLMQLNPRIRLGGSIPDGRGGSAGVFMQFEADNIETVRKFADSSPYAEADLYERIEIDPLHLEIGRL